MPPNPKVQQFLESEAIKEAEEEERKRQKFLKSLEAQEPQIVPNVSGRRANIPKLPVVPPSDAVKVYEGYFNPKKLVTTGNTKNHKLGVLSNVGGIPRHRTIIQNGGRRRTRRRQSGRRTRRHRHKKRRTHRR